ncbi:hypothetical protein IV102_09975 [bacterium]|nr:hypothetical protein [bacterium]
MRGWTVFFILWTLAGGWATPLPEAAARLYEQGLTHNRHPLQSSPPPFLEPTSDGRSYVAIWQTCEWPQTWIVSLPGSRGYAIEDLAVWQPHLRGRKVGLICLQWWLGAGDRAEDYLSPREIYREIDLTLQSLKVAAQSVVLEGFSRGSTQTFSLAALDVFAGRRYFNLIVASSGAVSENYPPTRQILDGHFGAHPLTGTRWITVAGGQDPNPDRDGIPAMRRSADWLKKQGAVVVESIEVPDSGHGALHRSSQAMGRLLQHIFGSNASTLQELSREYQRLRTVKGHFQGGQWNDEVDRWAGRKHEVMSDLGDALGQAGTRESDIIRWMGPPDERATPGSHSWASARPDQGDYLLVYCWRGHHDFLYFLCSKERVLSSQWWMAGE